MPAAFHEVRFPLGVAFGAVGGPERRTEIVVLGSGREERNSRWADARRRFNAGTGVRSLDDIAVLIDFFEERRGRLTGFRFRDPADFKSCLPSEEPGPQDQTLGTGDGDRRSFQLRKRYGSTHAPYWRAVEKPVSGSVRVSVEGEEIGDGHLDVDDTTGLVTLSAAKTPAPGAIVKAGFRFDCPVRFDTDRLEIDLAAFEAGVVPVVPIVEIRP
jgi:uncharacterized protein (TIGR02217 family)